MSLVTLTPEDHCNYLKIQEIHAVILRCALFKVPGFAQPAVTIEKHPGVVTLLGSKCFHTCQRWNLKAENG